MSNTGSKSWKIPTKEKKNSDKPIEGEVINKSPLPKDKIVEGKEVKKLNFIGAITLLKGGAKVTSLAWGNKDYGIMKDGFLMIYTKDAFHQWMISDGDMNANDWVIVE